MIKSIVQRIAKYLGYRIVPSDRDPQSIYKYFLRKDIKAVVDVGANTGQTCLHWIKELPDAHVYAFEPMPDAVRVLKHNTRRWSERISVFQVAASDTSGILPFQLHTEHTSSSSLQSRTKDSARLLPFTEKTETMNVRVEKIDAILSGQIANGMGETLLKLDVQGHELSVLRGSEELLRQTRFILTEVNLLPLYEQQPNLSDLMGFLRERRFELVGFVEQFHLNSGKPVYFDALFERKAP